MVLNLINCFYHDTNTMNICGTILVKVGVDGTSEWLICILYVSSVADLYNWYAHTVIIRKSQ